MIQSVERCGGSAIIGAIRGLQPDFLKYATSLGSIPTVSVFGLTITATAVPSGPSVLYPTVDTMFFANLLASGAIALHRSRRTSWSTPARRIRQQPSRSRETI